MRAWGRWIVVAASAVATLAGALAFGTAAGTAESAQRSLEGAERLLAARRDVAEAESALGDSDLSDAIASAGEANATAQRAGRATGRIARLLAATREVAAGIAASSEQGVSASTFARRQTEVAAQLLAAIGGYQRDAGRYARMTNASLRRILRALRETNESFEDYP